MSSRRRRARDLAFQVLFQHDVGRLPVVEALAVARRQSPGADWAFVESVVTGTEANAAELDAVIEPLLEGWELDRLANVDRTILRLALYELRHMTTPSGVVINEAVELAKRYGTEASGSFVNGLLSAALDRVRPADHEPSAQPPGSRAGRKSAADPRPASRGR